MVSKVDQLMRNYDKIKQFPIDGPLMPLTEEQAASTQDNLSTKRLNQTGFTGDVRVPILRLS